MATRYSQGPFSGSVSLSGGLVPGSASSAAANTTALQTALSTAGSYAITTPGIYWLNGPITAAVDSSLYLGEGVCLQSANGKILFNSGSRINITGAGTIYPSSPTLELSQANVRGNQTAITQPFAVAAPAVSHLLPRANMVAWWKFGRQTFTDNTKTTACVANGDRVGFVQDLSGNQYHLEQTTAGNKPYYGVSGTGIIGTQPFIMMNATFGSAAASDTVRLDSIVNANGTHVMAEIGSGPFSLYVVYKPATTTPAASGGLRLVCASNGTNLYIGRDGANSAAPAVDGLTRFNYGSIQNLASVACNLNADLVTVESMVVSPTNLMRSMRNNYVTQTRTSGVTATTLSGSFTVGRAQNSGFCWAGSVAEVIIFKEAHDLATQRSIQQMLMRDYGLTDPHIVFAGNSFIAGYGSGGGLVVTTGVNDIVAQTRNYLSGTYTYKNYGVNGQTTTQMIANDGDRLAHYASEFARGRCILVCSEGTNDMSASDGNLSAAAALVNVATYCQARKSEGWKIIWQTTLPRNAANAGAGFEARRQEYNAALRANPGAYGIDVLVDPGVDTGIWDVNNLTTASGYWQNDLIHPSYNGASILGRMNADAILTVY